LPTGSQHTHLMLTDTPNCNPIRHFVVYSTMSDQPA